ncbi:NAD(P)H-dependent oxidoreductase [Zavarzinia compransoris]|uniref:NADPH:quinone reductase n=1 Tax=Zavarzinia compransoris TaxID=1264899 RepID=A0A317E158_9PROT|nr:NAD(P)H-dependent oxidoreductase [Zavarzinia compransoris]PWR19856.1 NADPH:quinone reductase [Zavarzinia compransoris]TDP45033.1 NAD(P)H dehydrogenase (quinone) [Zavarzinia compransoris]
MAGRRVLTILGHPSGDSFCAAAEAAYAEAAGAAGAEVTRLRLGEMAFDPILRHGYRKRQDLEPDLERARAAILAAEHVVFVYPIWWGSVPALLKGFLDRSFLPGFAFAYRGDGPSLPDKLLKGRSGRLIVTLDTPGWFNWLAYGAPGHRMMTRTVLKFCGISPVARSTFAPVRNSTPAARAAFLTRLAAAGRRDALSGR